MAVVYVECVAGQPVRARMYVPRYKIWETVELPPATPQQKFAIIYNFARPRGAYFVKEVNQVGSGAFVSASVSLPAYAAHLGLMEGEA